VHPPRHAPHAGIHKDAAPAVYIGVAAPAVDIRIAAPQHRKKFGAGAGTFGFSFDALNVVFEMRGPDAAEVTSVEHWPRGKVNLRRID